MTAAARVNGGLMLLAVAMLIVLFQTTGRIPVNNGEGYDGYDYARQARLGWHEGTANTALRPLIIAANQPALAITDGNAVRAFRAMNYVYGAFLALALGLLLDRYGVRPGVKVFIVANVFACWAFAKVFVYYPVLVDLGALAVITFALWIILRGGVVLAALACIAAVLAREFGIGVVAFGLVHGLRTRQPWWRVLLTYAPAAAVFFWWRSEVTERLGRFEQLLTMERLIDNLALWRDPLFAVFFIYFILTVVGGVSMLVVARSGGAWRLLRREPEWLAFAALIVGPAVAGNADIWRYIAFLLPLYAVLCALALQEMPRRQLMLFGALVVATTAVTQRPWQFIELPYYFRDWFPYYIHRGIAPAEATLPLWPVWGWRMLAAALMFWIMTMPSVPASAPARADLR